MRRHNDVKETTRRLIKAGIALGILGGGAATHMDAWAVETNAEETKGELDLGIVDGTDAAQETGKTDDTELKNDKPADFEEKKDEYTEKVQETIEQVQSAADQLGVATGTIDEAINRPKTDKAENAESAEDAENAEQLEDAVATEDVKIADDAGNSRVTILIDSPDNVTDACHANTATICAADWTEYRCVH